MKRRRKVEPLTTLFCVACVLIWAALAWRQDHSDLTLARWGALQTEMIWGGAWWGLLTSAFVHVEIWHLAFNLFWLWTLGSIMEREFGSLRFLLFFLGADWVSSAGQLATGYPGMGMSGVGYALFGFGWLARGRVPAFGRILDDLTIRVFLIWLVGCWVATQLHWASIANAAHVAGLVFGAGVAAAYTRPERRRVLTAGLVLLCAASCVPLFWCPWTSTWVMYRAQTEEQQGHYARAVRYYKRSLKMGAEPAFVWRRLAYIYAQERNTVGLSKAIGELLHLDPQSAAQLQIDFRDARQAPPPVAQP